MKAVVATFGVRKHLSHPRIDSRTGIFDNHGQIQPLGLPVPQRLGLIGIAASDAQR